MKKFPVSERALIARINRALRRDEWPGYQLRKTRGNRALFDMGAYYVHDVGRNNIIDHHVDIEAYGRELGVLADFECLAPEEEGR